MISSQIELLFYKCSTFWLQIYMIFQSAHFHERCGKKLKLFHCLLFLKTTNIFSVNINYYYFYQKWRKTHLIFSNHMEVRWVEYSIVSIMTQNIWFMMIWNRKYTRSHWRKSFLSFYKIKLFVYELIADDSMINNQLSRIEIKQRKINWFNIKIPWTLIILKITLTIFASKFIYSRMIFLNNVLWK